MKPKLALILILITSNISLSSQNCTNYVDLFMCTANDNGQLDPAATVPWGMIKLGPDTDPGNHSGYNYYSTKISGFSHNRIGGVGCSGAGGNLRILPGTGSITGISLSFKKETEKAAPGYYSVEFENGITAKLTATNQTGFHRYMFPASDSAFLRFDLKSSFADFIAADYEQINERELVVTVSAKNVCNVGRYTVHYHIWCDKNLTAISENDLILTSYFKTMADEQIQLKVTVSPISRDDARAEWESGTRQLTFDQAKDRAAQRWEQLLSRIIVEGKEEYKTLFYTHLYHTLLNPVQSENREHQFQGTDGNIHTADDYTHYDCWSMWDNFRNKFSLYAIIIPDVSRDIARSLVDLYRFGKPCWSGYYEPVPTVRTEHTVVTLLDLYRRGITDFDISPVYQKLCAEITNQFDKTPDKKLELCYDYWAMAQFAKILDKEDDYQLFMAKAQEYKPVWKKYFLTITDKSDIMHGDGLYEGTLWQYRWHVQFDVHGIIDMIGGKDKYVEQLSYFFDNYLYNHGNQPDIHVPFMFNFGDAPWLTQKWVNEILTKETDQYYGTHEKWDEPYTGRIYKADPEGYIPEMDDDEGTMSGWFVLSSMGMYPVLVGDPVFQMSTPIFEKIVFKLSDEKTFTILTEDFSDTSYYIKSATLSGEPFNQSYITHDQIVNGGTLVIRTSAEPNKEWGHGTD